MERYHDFAKSDPCRVNDILLRIPPEWEVPGAETLRSQTAGRRNCTFVGKGPSAMRAKDNPEPAHVATVNEACRLVPGGIDYAFFTDLRTVEASRADWARIRHFVMPPVLHAAGTGAGRIQLGSIDGLPLGRVIVVPQSQLPQESSSIKQALNNGWVCYTDTATMGLHVLAMLGYRHFFLYGHDGGVGYAPGVPCLFPNQDHTLHRQLLEELLVALSRRQALSWEFRDNGIVY